MDIATRITFNYGNNEYREKIMRIVLGSLMMVLALSACKKDGWKGHNIMHTPDYPLATEDDRRLMRGTLTGKEYRQGNTLWSNNGGGIGSWFGGGNKTPASSNYVNNHMWQAAVDTLSFMPMDDMNPQTGFLKTDWYTDAKAPNERFKVSALVNSGDLTANGVNVNVFKEANYGSGWVAAPVGTNVSDALEEKIIVRARELAVAAQK